MEELRDLFDSLIQEIYEMVEKDVLKKKKIRKMSEIDEVLGQRTLTEFDKIIDIDLFYIGDPHFYIDVDGQVISKDKEDLIDMVDEALKEMDYSDQLKLIKKAIKIKETK